MQNVLKRQLLLKNSIRAFSKNEQKPKASRKEFIRRELTENPEYFKAYPHLQFMFEIKNENELHDPVKYHHDKQIIVKDRTKEVPYFESLT